MLVCVLILFDFFLSNLFTWQSIKASPLESSLPSAMAGVVTWSRFHNCLSPGLHPSPPGILTLCGYHLSHKPISLALTFSKADSKLPGSPQSLLLLLPEWGTHCSLAHFSTFPCLCTLLSTWNILSSSFLVPFFHNVTYPLMHFIWSWATYLTSSDMTLQIPH